ncbi:T9SS type A sorting domain-containing protein [Subsaxibacter sp. CAU 1640]|uniref:T9SS type A sorting domain-containing protein n=1 Tax=Subsaxibacter sp. CAU 1640 TaxID=2933271 RepID=UPI0020069411|nr:T9SS type A sorting domain-containing protein [Subsaxibacter sp. CAU 1640]MCK7590101.1 T9SS type A sorting domain-containing protein [Subsaxibacter sp. CAU 1640]
MKNNYTHKLFLTLLLSAFSFMAMQSQVRLQQVDPATGAVTLHNYGASTVNVGTYWLCNFPSYDQLSSLTVTSGSLNLAAGAEVTVTSSIGLQVADSELGLYNSSSFGSSTAMQDYLQWGSAGHQREVVAVNKGIWTAGTFVSATPPLAYTGNGSQNGAQFWDAALSVGEFENSGNFKIVQNPTQDVLQLEFSQTLNQADLTVYNILGHIVMTEQLNSTNSAAISVSGYSKGIYFVTVASNSQSQTKKFIKN